MASPGADDQRTYILSINFLDGKGFGPELQAVTCAATFAGETKLTPYSVGREAHVWNTTMQWRVTMDQFRRLSALGQKDCKVVLSAKDGTKLGWFLIDMRAAKLQAQYKKDEGVWNTLSGAKKGETPQVCALALFYEDRPDAWSPGPKQASPGRQRAPGRKPAASGRAGGGGAADGADEVGASGDLPGPGDGAALPSARAAGGSDAAGGDGAGFVAAGEPPGANPTAGLPNFGSPPRRSPADDGPFRHFALTVDVRSFQSTKRLPLSSANVYVQAVLPAELIELVVGSGFKLPARLAPLTSHPAVDIPRGAEGAVPGAYGTLEFSAGVVELARVLAREPRISVEAWHKERFRTDMLLGSGSVPLTPLLQGAWVDGYAPLFAVVASSVGGELREERVQMGMLRVVLALEDKGPAPQPGSEAAAAAVAAAAAGGGAARTSAVVAATTAPAKPDPYALDGDAGAAAPSGLDAFDGVAAGAGGAADGGLQVREMHPAPTSATAAADAADAAAAGLPAVHAVAPPPALLLPPPPALAPGGGPARLPPGMGMQGSPEFEAAWELEVWKRGEEARWRSELREREAQRMMVLESEWRRRERAREAEIGALKSEYLGLEERAQQVLSSAEARERRILAAEEALLRRRKELEREAGSRLAEAEAAVRRLQVECEHQLDIERDRNAELVRRVAMLEERLAASDARCLAVENEFADFRAATRSTPEAELTRQLAAAREAAKAAEVRAAKAAKAKQGYKDQVRKLAEQLAALQRRRQRDEDVAFGRPAGGGGGGGGGGHQLSASLAGPPMSLRAAAEEQIRAASSQQQELAAMRLQLQAIKAAALAQLSPGTSPRAGQEASAAAGQSAAAAAGGAAGGAVAADDAPDLRSSDQQRGRHAADWRPAATGAAQGPSGAPGGGTAASRGPSVASEAARSLFPPDPTPASSAARPAGAGPSAPSAQGGGPQRSTTTSSSSNPTTSSSISGPPGGVAAVTAGQLRQAHEDLYAAAAAAQQRLFPAAQGATAGPAGSSGSAPAGPSNSGGGDRWAAARVAASAPAAPGGVSPASVAATPQSATPQNTAAADAAPPPAAASVSASAPSTGADAYGPGQSRGYDGDSRPSTASNTSPPGAAGSGAAGGGRAAAPGGGAAGALSDAEKRSLADHLASANHGNQWRQQQPYPGEAEGFSPASSGAAAASAPSWLEHGREFLAAQQQQPYPYSQQQAYSYSAGDLGGGGSSGGSVGAGGGGGGGGDGSSYMYGSGGSFRDLVGPTADLAEIQRLTRRKMELLQSGSYGLHDTVIRLLDERIQALMAESAGLPA
ncbi:hypothetical protein HXX76_008792 [Chlamydomonas incerta]|uniref:C2 domain-containing protein n=1 Tax=Chlamydomonas incerta TaxID=51695 RepID=A0A835W1B3_CHLIN|nr:hypothetical protein HXX76_008792 [Chlamydomonas incerta]|eukprot:KAG2432446.1 hypothetical protein HXX76_008792 [Chlamydomonas incerta]